MEIYAIFNLYSYFWPTLKNQLHYTAELVPNVLKHFFLIVCITAKSMSCNHIKQ